MAIASSASIFALGFPGAPGCIIFGSMAISAIEIINKRLNRFFFIIFPLQTSPLKKIQSFNVDLN